MADTPPAPAPGKKGGLGSKKILGMPAPVVITFGVVVVGAAIYFYMKRKKTAATTGSASASSSAYGIDQSGELSTIQQELESLLAGQGGGSAGSGSGGGGSYGGGGSGTGAFPGANSASGATTGTGTTGTTSTPSTGTTGTTSTPSGGGTTTATPPKTTPAPAPAKQGPPPMPSGVHATKVTSNSVTLAWSPSAGATGYNTRVTYQGKNVNGVGNYSKGTTVTVSGLGADHTYTFHVLAGGPGGNSPETNGPAVKTTR
jgi:hypothetical protein